MNEKLFASTGLFMLLEKSRQTSVT